MPSDEELTNHIIWLTINEALTEKLGMEHIGGGDGTFGFEDEYKKGNFKITIGMKNNG
jgi:hypothetical protein